MSGADREQNPQAAPEPRQRRVTAARKLHAEPDAEEQGERRIELAFDEDVLENDAMRSTAAVGIAAARSGESHIRPKKTPTLAEQNAADRDASHDVQCGDALAQRSRCPVGWQDGSLLPPDGAPPRRRAGVRVDGANRPAVRDDPARDRDDATGGGQRERAVTHRHRRRKRQRHVAAGDARHQVASRSRTAGSCLHAAAPRTAGRPDGRARPLPGAIEVERLRQDVRVAVDPRLSLWPSGLVTTSAAPPASRALVVTNIVVLFTTLTVCGAPPSVSVVPTWNPGAGDREDGAAVGGPPVRRDARHRRSRDVRICERESAAPAARIGDDDLHGASRVRRRRGHDECARQGGHRSSGAIERDGGAGLDPAPVMLTDVDPVAGPLAGVTRLTVTALTSVGPPGASGAESGAQPSPAATATAENVHAREKLIM